MSAVDAEQMLRRWVDGINQADIDGVAALYDMSAILLATFSPDTCSSRSQIKDYFRKYSTQGGLQVVLDEGSVVVQALGGGCHMLTGQYTFYTGTGDASSAHPARFTFIVSLTDEKILHHHSSRLPQAI